MNVYGCDKNFKFSSRSYKREIFYSTSIIIKQLLCEFFVKSRANFSKYSYSLKSKILHLHYVNTLIFMFVFFVGLATDILK